MKTFELTEAELKQIDYNDEQIANIKSYKQLLAMELKEKNKILLARSHIIQKSYEKVRNEPEIIFINHLMAWIKEEDLTEEIAEAETQFYI